MEDLKKFINCNTYKIVYIIKRKGKKLRRWVKKQIIDKVVGGWHVFSKNKKEGVGSFIGLHFFWLAEEKEKKETQFRSRFVSTGQHKIDISMISDGLVFYLE